MVVLKEVSSMFWGITLDGGKRYTQTVERSFNITMAAIEPPSNGKLSPVSVMVQVDKAEFLLCTLGYGNLLQQKLELLFTEGEEVTFFLSGNGVVHLTGFLVDDQMESVYPEDMGSLDSDSDSEAPELVDEDDTDDDSDDEDMVQVGKKRKMKEAQQGKKKIRTINDIEDDDDDEDDSDFDVTADIDDSLDDEDSDEDEEPVQSPSKEGKKKGMKSEKKIPTKSEISNSKSEMSTPQADSTDGKKKKKKKKKNKQKAEDNNQENQVKKESKQEKTEAGTPKGGTPKKRVLAGGLMVEEVKGGHGPDAKAGKVVSVYYVGTLAKNGKQFDSCQSGKPFKFRLGKNEVIKGWDQGLQGMRVGGKRRLTIPPQLGYGNQRQGPIPPNATLVFDVELKAVN